MTESDWVRYFRANAAAPCLPWDDGYLLSGAERAVVIQSIQQFQLGESAQGRRLLERAKVLDAEYVQALRMFIQEEQRHSALLGRFLASQGARCLRRHWVHAAFRRLRGWAGLELRMRVLATAEVLAIPYYTALRDATSSPLLRSICCRILAEEAEHLRFQAFTFGRLGSRRAALLRALTRAAHRCFLMATTLFVWMEHAQVFRAGGYSLRELWRQALSVGEPLLALHATAPGPFAPGDRRS
jgi:1,2-phenylacetyl-CoA epoxidase catalytic subunit